MKKAKSCYSESNERGMTRISSGILLQILTMQKKLLTSSINITHQNQDKQLMEQ